MAFIERGFEFSSGELLTVPVSLRTAMPLVEIAPIPELPHSVDDVDWENLTPHQADALVIALQPGDWRSPQQVAYNSAMEALTRGRATEAQKNLIVLTENLKDLAYQNQN